MNEQTQKRYKIDSKRLKRKKRESPTHPLDRKQAEFEFELMWPSICEAVLPNSLIQWISTWRCGVPAETPAPHPLQTSWSSDWAVPAVCSKLHQLDRTPPKTPTPPLTLFSLSHVVFTSASSHLNCTGSSMKGAVGARPSKRQHCMHETTVFIGNSLQPKRRDGQRSDPKGKHANGAVIL